MCAVVQRAVKILKTGGLVAFPTETVYGLGADATNPRAIERIFDVKGRPITNPLIVHVADEAVAKRYAADWPLASSRLAQRFWPGPLTLVVPKTDAIVPAVTAGLNTVGLRAPDHPLTLELLRNFDGPLAGPSANCSSHVSPTTAQHVRDELGDAVDLILDGGPCKVGIESTVLDLSTDRPTILRPGGISREKIESVIGPVELSSAIIAREQPARSPGQQETHYAPRTPAFRFKKDDLPAVEHRLQAMGKAVLLLLSKKKGTAEKKGTFLFNKQECPLFSSFSSSVIQMPADPDEYARALYSSLRSADELDADAIFVEMPPDEPGWLAVRDRLRRATKPLNRR